MKNKSMNYFMLKLSFISICLLLIQSCDIGETMQLSLEVIKPAETNCGSTLEPCLILKSQKSYKGTWDYLFGNAETQEYQFEHGAKYTGQILSSNLRTYFKLFKIIEIENEKKSVVVFNLEIPADVINAKENNGFYIKQSDRNNITGYDIAGGFNDVVTSEKLTSIPNETCTEKEESKSKRPGSRKETKYKDVVKTSADGTKTTVQIPYEVSVPCTINVISTQTLRGDRDALYSDQNYERVYELRIEPDKYDLTPIAKFRSQPIKKSKRELIKSGSCEHLRPEGLPVERNDSSMSGCY